MKHPDELARVLEEIEMDLRKGNIDFKQADAGRAAALAVSYRLVPKLDAALASCAEMRAALEAVVAETSLSFAVAKANQALFGPDLGAGMVAVAGPLDALVDNLVRVVCDCHDGSDLWAHTRRDPEAFRRAVRGALLKKGGG